MARDALRVLAVAEKQADALPGSDDEAESGLTFLGLIGLEDPPRPEAKQAVLECRAAGIRPVMITGDQPSTAAAIAGRLGIDAEKVTTGAELEAMSDEKLLASVKTCSVFARVSPAHKLRIVKAFRRLRLVTAMTGDGVNDAPALKAADIGCAMGRSGTEVAKNADGHGVDRRQLRDDRLRRARGPHGLPEYPQDDPFSDVLATSVRFWWC